MFFPKNPVLASRAAGKSDMQARGCSTSFPPGFSGVEPSRTFCTQLGEMEA